MRLVDPTVVVVVVVVLPRVYVRCLSIPLFTDTRLPSASRPGTRTGTGPGGSSPIGRPSVPLRLGAWHSSPSWSLLPTRENRGSGWYLGT